jgi:exonuclease I
LTGITQAAAERFGYEPEQALEDIARFMDEADAVLGQNVIRFDKPMTENAAKRAQFILNEKLWVDTMTDIPGVKGEQLITMCAKAGVLMPNAHGALIDASSTLEMARRHAADPNKSFEKMVERAKSPTIVLRIHQPNTPANNRAVGKLGFRWNGEFKLWWRATKEMDVEEIAKNAPFDVSRVGKEVSLEMLQD